MNSITSIGSRIRNIRGRESRSSFAEKLNIGTATLQRYEGDERSPDIDFLVKLQQITGYSLDYLIYGKESSIPNDEALILEKYRQASSDIRNKMLMLLLGGNEAHATNSVVNSGVNTGSISQISGKKPTIDNRNQNQTNNFNGDFGGDYVNGDKS
ncbi:helix-turn-helix transcriptional regulator [Acinetobacter guillouiae]|uniref:helix-turn-helix domain-containing protein n=1 Tax=Acinetobacter guillouiae TaxID=106649 RepID=UPI0028D54D44|nr:helix-turn-helix transcriptional regulator [Acinetobacter guillouiae]